MTTESLTWPRVKDALVLSIGAGLLGFLGLLAKGQADANASLAEVRRDIAVILVGQQRDREEVAELKVRVKDLEMGRN